MRVKGERCEFGSELCERVERVEAEEPAEVSGGERNEPAHLARSKKVPLKSSSCSGVVGKLSAGVATPEDSFSSSSGGDLRS